MSGPDHSRPKIGEPGREHTEFCERTAKNILKIVERQRNALHVQTLLPGEAPGATAAEMEARERRNRLLMAEGLQSLLDGISRELDKAGFDGTLEERCNLMEDELQQRGLEIDPGTGNLEMRGNYPDSVREGPVPVLYQPKEKNLS